MAARPRRVILDLADPAYDPIFAFVAAAYPGLPTSSAVRELLLTAAGVDQQVAAAYETRKAVRYRTEQLLRQRIIGNLVNALNEFRAEEAIAAAIGLSASTPSTPSYPERAA